MKRQVTQEKTVMAIGLDFDIVFSLKVNRSSNDVAFACARHTLTINKNIFEILVQGLHIFPGLTWNQPGNCLIKMHPKKS